VFGDVFGGRARGPRRRRGSDLRYDLEISFVEAARGCEKIIAVPRLVPCDDCRGSGAKPGTSPVTCPTCRGAGQLRYQQGFFSVARTCGHCGGKGTVIQTPCHACRGRGLVEHERQLKVKIPAGVDTGATLRLRGEGELGEMAGPPGDLHVVIRVEEHPLFRRQGSELIVDLPISFPQAALGDEIEVPTLDGSAKAGTNYTATNGTLSFAAGETNKLIVVPILDDAQADGTRYFHVLLSNTTGGAALGTAMAVWLGPRLANVTVRPLPALEIGAEAGPTLWSTFDRLAIDFAQPTMRVSPIERGQHNPWSARLGTEWRTLRRALALRAGLTFDQ
jgi:hypothetical protein